MHTLRIAELAARIRASLMTAEEVPVYDRPLVQEYLLRVWLANRQHRTPAGEPPTFRTPSVPSVPRSR